MRKILILLRTYWIKIVLLFVVIAAGLTWTISPTIRHQGQHLWRATLAWSGLGGDSSVDLSQVFWCPMHPQIKSHKPNSVCPICNMALVELEGGVVEAADHLTLTVQQVQQAGVVTRPILRRTLSREIDTTGRVDYDERNLAKISSWIRGKSRIEKLQISFMGQTVKKGEPLAELYSPELIAAQEEFLLTLNMKPGSPLAGTQRKLTESARLKLKYQGMTEKQIEELRERGKALDRIPIYAPISGTVIKRHIQEGEYVMEGDVLFEVADLSKLWLFVDIYEEELELVPVGTSAELSVSSLPGQRFEGTVQFIDTMVKPETRTIPVRINVDNQTRRLLPGMFARVKIRREFPEVLAVPEQAVLWSGQRSVVILKSGEGTFRPMEIATGKKWLYNVASSPPSAALSLGFGENRTRYHEIVDGVQAGDEIVTSGVFLLNAESQFQSILTKMLPPASERATLEDVLGNTVARQVREVLDRYFDLSQTLAEDKIEEVLPRLKSLTQAISTLSDSVQVSGSEELRQDVVLLQNRLTSLSTEPIQNSKDARTRFGKISFELTRLLTAHGGKTLFGDGLYQFECGMAKVGYERWLWRTPQIFNPYMGQKMLTCGKKLDLLEP